LALEAHSMPQRVLLIDDSKVIHDLVKARLEGEPITFHSAQGGEEGLKMAGGLLPDLILLDVDMPQMDGHEVCRRLKSNPATVDIPVIFLGGAVPSSERMRGLDLGAMDYINKPFNPAEVRARVRAGLRMKYMMDLLARKVQIDPLTGLWNQAYFEDRVHQELSLARRSGRPLACILVDVDGFKSVNESNGRPFGDDVLRHLASALSQTPRAEEIVCRSACDRFWVLSPNTPADGAQALAERCRRAIANLALQHRGQPVKLTCSFGVADHLDTPSMLEAAEQALHLAKNSGRDRVGVASHGVHRTPSPKAA
jgi:two-component system, cell cycle response regulator